MQHSRVFRLLRHLGETHWLLKRRFPSQSLDRIEAAIKAAEASHRGEIRFAVEGDLHALAILTGKTPRQRALEVFAALRVWDTEANNGVLIYLLFADRAVEIVADRGFNGLVSAEEWAGVCRAMEADFRGGRFTDGTVRGVAAVGALVARHFPGDAGRNALGDRPVIL